MGTFDEEEVSGPAALDRLKAQLAEQHRRIRELEPLAEAANEVRAMRAPITPRPRHAPRALPSPTRPARAVPFRVRR